MAGTPLPERKAWQELKRHHAELAGQHLRELFAADPGRGERLTAEAAGLYLDYSKNRVTDETMRLLIELAAESGVAERRDACSAASTSTCPRTGPCCTWRCGCRGPHRWSWTAPTWCAQVHEVLDRMADFSNRVRSGEWKGHTGNGSGTWSTWASAARTWAR